MKILFLWPDRLRLDFGGPKIVLELAEALRGLGWETTLYDPWTLPDQNDQKTPWQDRCRTYLHQHSHEFDVIDYDHGRLPFPRSEFSKKTLMVARSGLLGSHFLKIKIPDLYPFRDPLRRILRGKNLYEKYEENQGRSYLTCQEADLVNVANDDDKSELISCGISAEKIHVFPFGISDERRRLFEKVSVEVPPLAKIAFVGSFDGRKGGREFPEIVKGIIRKVPEAKVCLFGTKGRFSNAEEVRRFFPPRLHRYIEIVSEYRPNDLPEMLAECSLGIFPSYIEGFPFGVLEMLAAALPVIAYDAPGAPMMLSPKDLVPRGDVAAMVDKVVSLLNDQEGLAEARRKARSDSHQFNWNRTAEGTSHCYREAIKRVTASSKGTDGLAGVGQPPSPPFNLQELLKNPLIIYGFPKSGNTWLGLILAWYYGVPYLDAHDKLNEEARFQYSKLDGRLVNEAGENLPRKDHSWTCVIKSHYQIEELIEKIKGNHGVTIKCSHVPILIIREPRDVSVSYYYYNYFHVPVLQGYNTNRVLIYFRLLLRRVFYFEKFVLKIAGQWAHFHRCWTKIFHHSIRYEELTQDTYGSVSRLILNLDGKISEDKLRSSIEYCRFENLRKMENQSHSYYSNNQYFFRKGISGGWKKYFGKKMSEKVRAQLKETYEEMGYGRDCL